MRNLVVLAALVVTLAPGLEIAAGQRQLTASGNARGANNAIVGRIVDASGNPVAGTFVTLLKQSVSRLDGSSRIGMVSARLGSVANERGEFRFENLSPGPYYPVAFPQNLRPGSGVQLSRTGYDVTYYPNLVSLAEAKPVVVLAASTIIANITLASAPLWVVSGSIIASSGQPWRGERLGITHAEGLFGLDSKAVSIQPNGAFAIPNLPKGTYCLDMHEGAWPPPRDAIPSVFGARVTIVDRDVTNVRVAPIRMVKAIGRVVVDPADRAGLQPSMISVSAAPANADCNPGPQRAGTIRDDLTFEFRTWPGLGHVRLSKGSLGDVPATIRLNGADVTKTGIDFVDGTDVSGLVLEMGSLAAQAPR